MIGLMEGHIIAIQGHGNETHEDINPTATMYSVKKNAKALSKIVKDYCIMYFYY